MKKLKEQGITLVALIVTMVIMLVIAGVSIGMVTGSGTNLIARAQASVIQAKIADVLDRLEMAKSATLIKTGGILTLDDYFDTLKEWGLLEPDGSNLKDNGDGTYTLYVDGYPYIIWIDEDGEIHIVGPGGNDEHIPVINPVWPEGDPENPDPDNPDYVADPEDGLPGSGPWFVAKLINNINVTQRTSRSIDVSVQTSSLVGPTLNPEYRYYISWDNGETFIQDGGSTSSSTHTYDGLDQNSKYILKILVSTDHAVTAPEITRFANLGISLSTGQIIRVYGKNAKKETETLEVPSAIGQIEWQYSKDGWASESWTNGDVTVKISPKIDGYHLQNKYISESGDENSWVDDVDEVTLSNYGQKIQARLWDGRSGTGDTATNVGIEAEMTATFIDKDAPTDTAPIMIERHPNNIQAQLGQDDELSGMAKIEWKIGTNKVTNENGKVTDVTGSWTTTDDITGTSNTTYNAQWVEVPVKETNTYKFENLKYGEDYVIISRVTDKAGNVMVSKALDLGTINVRDFGYSLSTYDWSKDPITVTFDKGASNSDFTLLVTDQEQDSKPVFGTPYTDIATQTRPIIVSENNTTVYGVLWDGVNYSEIQSVKVTKIDKTSPNDTAPVVTEKTSRTITVSFEQKDRGNGNSGSGIEDKPESRKFRLYDKDKNLLLEETQPIGTGTTHTFTKDSASTAIHDGTEYYVATYAIDAVGNEGTPSQYTKVTTDEIPGETTKPNSDMSKGIILTPSTSAWTSESVTVTATKDTTNYPEASKYNIEMNQTGSADGGPLNTTETVTTNNNTVYAYLTDRNVGELTGYANRKYSATLKITKLDKDTPSTPTVSQTVTRGDNTTATSGWGKSVRIYATSSDSTSGISTIQYSYNNSTGWTNMTYSSASGTNRTYYVDIASNTAATGQGIYFRAIDNVTVGTAHTSGSGSTTYYCDTQAPNDTAPTVSSVGETSFTITLGQADNGPSGIGTHQYYISGFRDWTTFTGNDITITGLTDGTTYNVYTRCWDNALNGSTQSKVKQQTTVVAYRTVTVPSEWTGGGSYKPGTTVTVSFTESTTTSDDTTWSYYNASGQAVSASTTPTSTSWYKRKWRHYYHRTTNTAYGSGYTSFSFTMPSSNISLSVTGYGSWVQTSTSAIDTQYAVQKDYGSYEVNHWAFWVIRMDLWKRDDNTKVRKYGSIHTITFPGKWDR